MKPQSSRSSAFAPLAPAVRRQRARIRPASCASTVSAEIERHQSWRRPSLPDPDATRSVEPVRAQGPLAFDQSIECRDSRARTIAAPIDFAENSFVHLFAPRRPISIVERYVASGMADERRCRAVDSESDHAACTARLAQSRRARSIGATARFHAVSSAILAAGAHRLRPRRHPFRLSVSEPTPAVVHSRRSVRSRHGGATSMDAPTIGATTAVHHGCPRSRLPRRADFMRFRIGTVPNTALRLRVKRVVSPPSSARLRRHFITTRLVRVHRPH